MIETRRLLLRPYERADWIDIHEYASVPEFSRFEAWGPNSVEDTQRFVDDCISSMAKDPILGCQLAVVFRETGKAIGGCTLRRKNPESTEAFIGYAVNPDYQRSGVATEAASALVDFGFSQWGLSRIYAECDARNIASRRVMEKLGMRQVSLRLEDREVKGVVVDTYEYEIRSGENRLIFRE